MNLLHLRQNVLMPFLRPGLQAFQLRDEMSHQIFLGLLFELPFPVERQLFPDLFRLLLKQADRIPALDLGTVVLILSHIFFQNDLKFLHPVPLFIQLAFHRVQKPFFHQPLLVTAVGKQLGKAGLLQVHLLDDALPLLIVDLVLLQLVEILPGLGPVVHIIIEKMQGAVPLVLFEHLTARRKIFQNHFFFSFFHHRKMMNVLNAGRSVFTDKVDHLQVFPAVAVLAAPHHHPGQHEARVLIQCPLHQDERRLAGGEIAFKGAVLGVPVASVDKGGGQHLNQDGFSPAVAQGDQRALAVEVKGLIADPDRVVIVVDID